MLVSPPTNTEEASPADVGQYARLLKEAESIRGISLWQDGWKRLKKNRAAMASLLLLGIIALLAFTTPLLPLQSPIYQDLDDRTFLRPNLEPMQLLTKDPKTSEKQPFSMALARYREQLASAEGKGLEAARRSHPLDRLWHHPGPVARLMIRARLALFGDWCIPSLFGTDDLGRDLLARIFWGSRVSLIVGIVATMVSLVIGVSYGAAAGYLGGLTDTVMMRIVDILSSIPFIFVVIFLVTILSQDDWKRYLATIGIDKITIFYIVIGAIYWLTMARVVRGQVKSLKQEQFVDAARTIGAGSPRIIFKHLVPNVLGIVIVYLTLTIPSVMLFEAFLSFLGLGVEPPDVSWGLLANDGIKVITPIRTFWWLVLFPGLALAGTLFALNFLGDGLRDALDPRMKNR